MKTKVSLSKNFSFHFKLGKQPFVLTSLIIFTSLILFSQTEGYTQVITNKFPRWGAAGIGTTTPHASSLLEVQSTSAGILTPRMTMAQRDAIVAPALGLLVFQTDGISGFYYFDGTAWVPGTTGPIGPQGPIGLTGPTGPSGPQGIQGQAGTANISGTTNYVAKFTDATTAGNSQIYDDGTYVRIGSQSIGSGLFSVISSSRSPLVNMASGFNSSGTTPTTLLATATNTSGGGTTAIKGVASGSGGTMTGIYGSAIGGTNNWAGYFEQNTYTGGSVGIGTSNLIGTKLVVEESSASNTTVRFQNFSKGSNASYIHLGATGDWYIRSANSTGKVVLQDDGGVVCIGGTQVASGYILSVNGRIMCEELKVLLHASWPDYVFAKNYDLMPLKQLENFVQTNKHLPGVPSASEMEMDGGIAVGEMQILLLKKLEEANLYILQLNKRVEELEAKLK